MKTILIIGLGDLGRVTLELLARDPTIEKIVVGSRNKEKGEQQCNLARLGGLIQGCTPIIQFTQMDLFLVEQTAEIIQHIKPNVILCTASLMQWWFPRLFPHIQAKELQKIPFGAWLPLHLTLPMKLMQALKLINYKGITIMAPFPDAVNQILGYQGLTPTIGTGNIDEIVPKIQLLAAERLNVSPISVDVTLVAHHALETAVFGHSKKFIPPFYLKIWYDGVDITEQVNARQLLLKDFSIPDGPNWHFLTGSSIVRLIKAFLSPQNQRLHAPGPHGLPGGYPVIITEQGVEIGHLYDISLEQAVQINERSHSFDGIQKIEPDGSVLFTKTVERMLLEIFGYSCKKLQPEDVEFSAQELIFKINTYAQKHRVNLSH